MNVHLARACLVTALTNTIRLVVAATILATSAQNATKVSSSASSNVHCAIHVTAQRPKKRYSEYAKIVAK